MCATRSSRQCNQAKCAITHRVDLTSGHLVKLKTRHLCCTRSLLSITPSAADWLRGDLRLHKCPGEPQWEAQTSHSTFDTHGHHPLRWCLITEGQLSVFRTSRNTCRNETGHLVPLPGERSLSCAGEYRPPPSSTSLIEV